MALHPLAGPIIAVCSGDIAGWQIAHPMLHVRLGALGGTMPFSGQALDADTLAVMTAVFDAAWADIEPNITTPAEARAAKETLAALVMDAVASTGECDPQVLKLLVLQRFYDPFGDLSSPD